MSGGITVESKAFQAAFRDYLKVTSREMSVALNGKLRDLMFAAAKYAPFNNAEMSPGDYARNRSQEYITFKTIQKYGANPEGVSRGGRTLKTGLRAKRKGSHLSPGQVWGMTERNKVARRLRKRHSGLRGYMSSAFIKAGLKFAPAASKGKKPKKRYYGSKTGGEAYQANPGKLVSLAVTHWSAKSSKDAGEKQRLAEGGIRAGLREIVADMQRYMAGKMTGAAKKVSA